MSAITNKIEVRPYAAKPKIMYGLIKESRDRLTEEEPSLNNVCAIVVNIVHTEIISMPLKFECMSSLEEIHNA